MEGEEQQATSSTTTTADTPNMQEKETPVLDEKDPWGFTLNEKQDSQDDEGASDWAW